MALLRAVRGGSESRCDERVNHCQQEDRGSESIEGLALDAQSQHIPQRLSRKPWIAGETSWELD